MSFPTLDADKESFTRMLQRMEGPFSQFAMQIERQKQADGKVKTFLFLQLS